MLKKSFPTFRAASTYAQCHAREVGEIVTLARDGEGWSAAVGSGEPLASATDDCGFHFPNVCTELTQEQKRQKAEQKARESEAREDKKRRPYLAEREEYYRALSSEQLDDLWNERESLNLEPDEIELLRKIVREIKGIRSAYGNSVKVCRCGMVGDNCTCKRSWF